MGRTSNRDAEVTPASLGIADNDKRLKSSVDRAGASMAIGRPTAALKTSGKDDMKTSGFQGTFRAAIKLWGGYLYSPFVRF